MSTRTCPACKGSGRNAFPRNPTEGGKCANCGGSGTVTEKGRKTKAAEKVEEEPSTSS